MKTNSTPFMDMLESVLVNVWGSNNEQLSVTQLKHTRKALSEIRKIYRLKGEDGTPQPSNISYKSKKYRAGYLAAFGEAHAYLSFLHLKDVFSKCPGAIPIPSGKRRELVVTSLGAGACVELYGVCLYYLQYIQRHLHITLNTIEKERSWTPNRQLVFVKVLKQAFPKIDVDPVEITLDLRKDNIAELARYYDSLSNTDILLIYNVLNEIPVTHTKYLWKNLKFLIDNFKKDVLILVMEPSAGRAQPRIYNIEEKLIFESDLINSSKEQTFIFENPPVCIDMNSETEDLNYRLFGLTMEGTKPEFLRKIKRNHLSCLKRYRSLISPEQIWLQLSLLGRKRSRKGTFIPKGTKDNLQHSFFDLINNWV